MLHPLHTSCQPILGLAPSPEGDSGRRTSVTRTARRRARVSELGRSIAAWESMLAAVPGQDPHGLALRVANARGQIRLLTADPHGLAQADRRWLPLVDVVFGAARRAA